MSMLAVEPWKVAGTVAALAVAWRYLRLPRAAVPTAGEVLAATKYALSGKEVLITGACNGIGLALALALLECPVKKLYLHGRCKERVAEVVARLPKAQRQKCCAAVADLSSLKEVDDLVATFTAPPDVIICCAGIATLPRWTASRDGYESQWAVNHLAHFHLVTQMAKSSSSLRVVMVSSDLQKLGKRWLHLDSATLQGINNPSCYSFLGNYITSKYCNRLFASSLARQGVEAVVCTPGEVATDIDRHLPWILRRLLRWSSRKLLPEQGAATLAFCASADVQPGAFYANSRQVHVPTEGAAEDELWQFSERLVAAALKH